MIPTGLSLQYETKIIHKLHDRQKVRFDGSTYLCSDHFPRGNNRGKISWHSRSPNPTQHEAWLRSQTFNSRIDIKLTHEAGVSSGPSQSPCGSSQAEQTARNHHTFEYQARRCQQQKNLRLRSLHLESSSATRSIPTPSYHLKRKITSASKSNCIDSLRTLPPDTPSHTAQYRTSHKSSCFFHTPTSPLPLENGERDDLHTVTSCVCELVGAGTLCRGLRASDTLEFLQDRILFGPS